MTKQELLLNLALECVAQADEPDFKFKDLLHDGGQIMFDTLKWHYPEYYKKNSKRGYKCDSDEFIDQVRI